MKRVAVLCCSISDTFRWMHTQFEVRQTRYSHRMVTLINGDEYILCSEPVHLMGYTFNEVIKAPSYETLEDLAKNRLRIESEEPK